MLYIIVPTTYKMIPNIEYLDINVEGVTLVLPSRLFMFIKYWRILALS